MPGPFDLLQILNPVLFSSKNPETRIKSWIKKFSQRKVWENKFAKNHPPAAYRIFSDPRGQNYNMEFWEILEGLN